MAKGKAARRIDHDYTENRDQTGVIRYKLVPVARGLAKGATTAADAKSAYARVVERKVVDFDALAQLVVEDCIGVNPSTVQYITATFVRTMVAQLKAGNRVTLNGFLSMGLAFEGRVDPARPQDVRNLPLKPWVRFAPQVFDELNRGAVISHDSPTLPTVVEVTEVYFAGLAGIGVFGKFRNVKGALTITLQLEDGTRHPCTFTLNRGSARSTRNIGKSLSVYPSIPVPAGTHTLHFTWPDGSSTPQTLSRPLPC